MAVCTYECMLIIDPNRFSRDPAGVERRIGEMIEKSGGELLVSRLWTEQRLAYPIKGHKKGVYWMTYFRLDGSRQAELNRATQLNTDILRALIIKLDPRIAGVIVEHAKTSKPTAPSTDDGRGLRSGRPSERELVPALETDEEE